MPSTVGNGSNVHGCVKDVEIGVRAGNRIDAVDSGTLIKTLVF